MDSATLKFEDDGPLAGVDDDNDEPNEFLGFSPDSALSVWLVKVPKSLMETWSNVNAEGVQLGTVRVYDQDATGQQKVQLVLPDHPQYDVNGETSTFDIEMTNQSVHSQYVLADKPNEQGPSKRARISAITGKVHHTATLRPRMDDAYEAKIRRRGIEANRPKKTIVRLEDNVRSGGASTNLKMIQSGATQTSAGFGTALKKSGQGSGKPQFERAARVSRDELLDSLFSLFTPDKPFWSMKDLRMKTAQPEAYLKETLAEIADFHKSGQNTNTFSLKAEYATMGMGKSAPAAGPSAGAGVKAEMDDDDSEDSEDSDEEMEEAT